MNLFKAFSILQKHQLKKLPLIIIAMIIGTLFEAIGLGLIIPLIDLISENNNRFIALLLHIPWLNDQNILPAFILIIAALYLLKGFFLAGEAWLIGRYVFDFKKYIVNTLMERYLAENYEFHLMNNSALLLRNLTIEANQFISNVLMPILKIMTECILIITICILLFLIEPGGVVIIFTFLALLSFIFYWFIGKYSSYLGKIRHNADGMIVKFSKEALAGFKDIKILGKEIYFLQQFNIHNHISCNVMSKQFVLNQLPKIYLETIGAIVFLIFLLFLINEKGNFQQIFPIIAVFSVAAFRLLPSFNRLLSALSSTRFGEQTLVKIGDHINSISVTDPSTSNISKKTTNFKSHERIEIKNLSYQYPGTKDLALSNIDLTIKKGDSIGIVGKSGAGKSTLLEIILGLLKPTAGGVFIDGINVFENIRSWQNLIGYVEQDIHLLDDSILHNIAFGENDRDIDLKKVNDALHEAKLDDFVLSLPEGIETNLGERGVRLSGGQKQRIGIARALYRNTPILVFDEATSALDNATESEIVKAINDFKGTRTTIVVAHRRSTIINCNQIIELKKGSFLK